MSKRKTLIRTTSPTGATLISEVHPSGRLERRFEGVDASEEEADIAQRMVLAYNATAGLTVSRLASLASPAAKVPLPDILAILDELVKADPATVQRILDFVRRGKNNNEASH